MSIFEASTHMNSVQEAGDFMCDLHRIAELAGGLVRETNADSKGAEVDEAVHDAAAATIDVIQLLIGSLVGVVTAFAIGVILLAIGRIVARRHAVVMAFARAVYKPAQVLLVVVGAWLGCAIVRDSSLMASDAGVAPHWIAYLNHAFMICTIISATWLIVGVFNGIKESIHERILESSERRAKRVQTQMQILHRVIVVIVWVLGFAGVLLTFPEARTVGASLLASAGVVSVVAGLAAQTTLGNVFAGLQLAFSDSIRVGDIVFYNNSYTTVEEITLTYVVLAVWDGRRIIVPSSLLTTQSFENWTRRAPEMIGDVNIDVDWAVPVAAARKQLKLILTSTDLWDGKTGVLQVSDAVGGVVRIRAVLSAKNSPTLSDLKNYVREKLVVWIQHEAPQAVPHAHNWAYEKLDFSEASMKTNQQVDAHVQAAYPVSYPPEGAGAGSEEPSRASGQMTRVLSRDEMSGLARSIQQQADDRKECAREGLIALAGGEDPANMREWQPPADDDAPASTLLMKRSDVEEMANVTKETSESALFSGSAEGEERQKNFAGPGDEAYEERKRQLERTNIASGISGKDRFASAKNEEIEENVEISQIKEAKKDTSN